MSHKWISHRGESCDAPENSIPAFRLSLERRTDGMECDVHLTSDKYVVVAHDSHTGRMGDRLVEIEKTTLAELRTIDISGAFEEEYPNEHIPLLTDVLPLLGEGREFYIELKPGDHALVPAVAAILAKSGIPAEQLVIISFDKEMISLSKEQMPQYRALWLASIGHLTDTSAAAVIEQLNAIHADGIDLAVNEYLITADFVRALHEAGKIVAVWTVDQPGQAKRMIEAGVDAITSNRAAKLRHLLSKK